MQFSPSDVLNALDKLRDWKGLLGLAPRVEALSRAGRRFL
jgi:hypothetical protein